MLHNVAFTLFGWPIYWYGITMATALACGFLLARFFTAKRAGIDPDSIYDIALIAVPLAIVGARIYYVIFMWDEVYSHQSFWEVFKVWNGGMAIYGAIIGGLIGCIIYCKWKKIPLLKLLDILVPCLILGQAIGRWGNFANQEAYGYAVTNPSLQFFPYAVFIQATGQYHLATFFYESMWNLLVFGFLMWYTYKKSNRREGEVFLYYLLLYGLGRMVIEGLRTDSLYLLNIRVSQWLSGALVLCALAVLIYWQVKKRPYCVENGVMLTAVWPPQEAAEDMPGEDPGEGYDTAQDVADLAALDGDGEEDDDAAQE